MPGPNYDLADVRLAALLYANGDPQPFPTSSQDELTDRCFRRSETMSVVAAL